MGKLTQRSIEAKTKATGRDFALADGGGLYLRVSRGGQRHWAFRYLRPRSRERVWMRLGDYGGDGVGLSLAEARAAAAKIAAERRETGIDPVKARVAKKSDERRAAVLKEEEERTVGAVFKMMNARELQRRRDGGASARRSYEKDVAPSLGTVPIRSVTRAQIVGLLDKVVARGSPVQANRTLQLVGQLFKFAILREIVENDPTRLITRKNVGGKEGERDRVLSEAEIIDLAKRLPASTLPKKLQHAVWILMSTLARVGELSQAQKGHVDLEGATWTIPPENSKNSRAHTIFLSPFAIEHFRALMAMSESAIWVLPARMTDSATEKSLERQALNKALVDRQWSKEKGQKPLRGRLKLSSDLLLAGGPWLPHDLRRTGATLMGELGVAPSVIERCLNHHDRAKVERIYQRQRLLEEQRQAWVQLGNRINVLIHLQPRSKTGHGPAQT